MKSILGKFCFLFSEIDSINFKSSFAYLKEKSLCYRHVINKSFFLLCSQKYSIQLKLFVKTFYRPIKKGSCFD